MADVLEEQMLLPVTTKTGLVIELNVDVAELDGDMVTVFVNESSIGFSLVVRRGDLIPRHPPAGQLAWAKGVATGSDR